MRAAVLALSLLVSTVASAAIEPLQSAPDFTLRSADGAPVRLAEQRGQVVMVNFWATWCAPCRIEMPHLARLYDKYRAAGFQLLAVNIDDDPRQGAAAAQRLGLKFPVLLDPDKAVTRRWDVGTMPSTVLIDRDGRVRHVHQGYRDGLEQAYEQQLRTLLKD